MTTGNNTPDPGLHHKLPKIGFISLGCPKNLVDSELILTRLRREGYDIVSNYDGADLVIVNTCGFINSAVEESLTTIAEALQENGQVLVTGCLGAREERIRQLHPQVLGITGPHAGDALLQQVHAHLPKPRHNPLVDLVPEQGIKLTPGHYAYLKISEGCSHRCTFCIIPTLRGDLVSRPIEDILNEAERLAAAGIKELLVISQDTSAYGFDIRYRTGFWKHQPLQSRLLTLCQHLGEMGFWVRLHYVYPHPHVDALIPLMAEGKLLPYLDIPFQHASPRILKLMRRPGKAVRTLQRIHLWRQQCPELAIRSTFIVGFPGETEAEFEQLLEWLQQAQLDRVGCFTYSAVDGASANTLPNPVPEAVKQDRYNRFMQVQQAVSTARLQQRIGQVTPILIDQVDHEAAVGRSYAEAPEIDGLVYLQGVTDCQAGDIIEARIEHSDEYDLWACPVHLTPTNGMV